VAFHQTTILIVDDDADTRELLSEFARLAGFAVRVAQDGVEALNQIVADDEIDALVSDLVMPGLDSLQLTAHARTLRPDFPVVLMTGHTGRLDEVLQAGAVPLIKPFKVDSLELAVRDAIDARADD